MYFTAVICGVWQNLCSAMGSRSKTDEMKLKSFFVYLSLQDSVYVSSEIFTVI